jgi:hypothetical protein
MLSTKFNGNLFREFGDYTYRGWSDIIYAFDPPARYPDISRGCPRYHVGRDGLIDIATRYGLDGPGIESR